MLVGDGRPHGKRGENPRLSNIQIPEGTTFPQIFPCTTSVCENTTDPTPIVSFDMPAGVWANGKVLRIQSIIKVESQYEGGFNIAAELSVGAQTTEGLGSGGIGASVDPNFSFSEIVLIRVDGAVMIMTGNGSDAIAPNAIDNFNGSITATLADVDFDTDLAIVLSLTPAIADATTIITPVSARAILS